MVKDALAPADAEVVKENDSSQEVSPLKPTGKGMRSMQGLDESPPPRNEKEVASLGSKSEKPADEAQLVAEEQPETFEITDWSGYPDGPKPEGPFRIVAGQEYENARGVANQANQALHRDNPALEGLEIHEVNPVKFGGEPEDLDNKIFVTPQEHAKYTTWWNNLLKNRTTG